MQDQSQVKRSRESEATSSEVGARVDNAGQAAQAARAADSGQSADSAEAPDILSDIARTAVPIWAPIDDSDDESDDDSDDGLASGWAFLRTVITLPVDDPVRSAQLWATASSTRESRQFIYRLFLEGSCVGVGPVFPVNTEARLDHWDVTAPLSSLQHRASQSQSASRPQRTFSFGLAAQCWALADRRFLAYLKVKLASGKILTFATNPRSWRSLSGKSIYKNAPSMGTGYFTAPQEHCDTTAYPFGFSCAQFGSTGWKSPVVGTAFARLELNPMPQTRVVSYFAANPLPSQTSPQTQPPQQPQPLDSHILDFQRTILGGVRVHWKLTRPLTLRLRFGEVCDSTGVKYQLNTGNTYEDIWQLSPGENELSSWGMRVFRYCQLDFFPDYQSAQSGLAPLSLANIPGTLTVCAESIEYPHKIATSPSPTPINSQAAAQTTSQAASFSSFRCNDPLLQRIEDLCAQTIRSCTGPMYVDSWTRERAAYEADAYLHMRAHNSLEFSPKIGEYTALWLLNNRTWPTEWPLYLVLMIHRLWAMNRSTASSADRGSADNGRTDTNRTDNLVRANWARIQQLLPEKYSTNGHIDKAPGSSSQLDGDLVDWPESERDGFVFSRANTVVNALASAAYRAAGELAGRAIGDDKLAAHYLSRSLQISTAIDRYAWNEEFGYADGLFLAQEGLPMHYGEHALAAVLAFCPPHDARKIARIHQIISTKKHIRGSVYEAAMLLEGLINIGEGRKAVELMAAGNTLHSWQHILSLVSGSTPEAWDASIKPNLTYSHPWAASPAYLLPLATVGDAGVSGELLDGTCAGDALNCVPRLSGDRYEHTVLIDTCGLSSVSSHIPTVWGSVDIDWKADSISHRLTQLHVTVNADDAQPRVRVLISPDCVPETTSQLPHARLSQASNLITRENPPHAVIARAQWLGNRLVKPGTWDLGTFSTGDYHFFSSKAARTSRMQVQ